MAKVKRCRLSGCHHRLTFDRAMTNRTLSVLGEFNAAARADLGFKDLAPHDVFAALVDGSDAHPNCAYS